MKKCLTMVSQKDLRNALDLAQDLIKAVHSALDQMPDAEIPVPDWVWRDIPLEGSGHKLTVDLHCLGKIRRTKKRT